MHVPIRIGPECLTSRRNEDAYPQPQLLCHHRGHLAACYSSVTIALKIHVLDILRREIVWNLMIIHLNKYT